MREQGHLIGWSRGIRSAGKVPPHTYEKPGESVTRKLEAREGFEPSHDGFADHSLRPLGYHTSVFTIMPKIYAQSYAQRALFLPIVPSFSLCNLLIPQGAA